VIARQQSCFCNRTVKLYYKLVTNFKRCCTKNRI